MRRLIAPLLAGAAVLASLPPLAARAEDPSFSADQAPPAAPPSADLPAICTDRPTKANVTCTVDAGPFPVRERPL